MQSFPGFGLLVFMPSEGRLESFGVESCVARSALGLDVSDCRILGFGGFWIIWRCWSCSLSWRVDEGWDRFVFQSPLRHEAACRSSHAVKTEPLDCRGDWAGHRRRAGFEKSQEGKAAQVRTRTEKNKVGYTAVIISEFGV